MKAIFELKLSGNGKGAIAAGIACAVAFLVLLLLSNLGFIASADIAYLTIILSALAAFLVLSDRLSEVSAVGVTVKLREAAADRVEAHNITTVGGQALSVFPKGPLSLLADLLMTIHAGDYVALTLQLSDFDERGPNGRQRERYDTHAVRQYLQAIQALTSNAYVLVVSMDEHFLGAVEALRFSNLSDDQLEEFVRALNGGDLQTLLRLRVLERGAAPTDIDNKNALNLMVSRRANFLVLLDEEGRPHRIATRAQVVERLVSALAEFSRP